MVGEEIKQRIKAEIGDWLTVSVGIGPNRFLAKTAANLHKPDGLDEINYQNFQAIYKSLVLEDLHGIAGKNAVRLHSAGIFTVLQMYHASVKTLKIAFQSILSYYWYLRLKGWEIDDVDFGRRSYGNSYALPKPFKSYEELAPLISKLTEKMGFRLRRSGYHAAGVHLAIVYRDHSFWHQSQKTKEVVFESRDIYKHLIHLFHHCPYRKPVAQLAVSVFNLKKADTLQLDLFGRANHQERISRAVDLINERWGNYVITPARMLGLGDAVPDRIAFGGVKEIEEFTLAGVI
jgi:DNA polymerase IV